MADKDTNVPNKTEYIKREAVFNWFCESADIDGCVDLPKNNGSCKKGCRYCISGKELDEIQTADVVEVVRCENCKYWDRDWKSGYGDDGHYCPMVDLVTDADFFCKYGDREGGVNDEAD